MSANSFGCFTAESSDRLANETAESGLKHGELRAQRPLAQRPRAEIDRAAVPLSPGFEPDIQHAPEHWTEDMQVPLSPRPGTDLDRTSVPLSPGFEPDIQHAPERWTDAEY